MCFWENDVFDPGEDDPSDENRGLTLRQGRENYRKWGAVREDLVRHARPPRPGELDGIHYHFMDVDSFRKWISMDQFLEYAEYVGNFYGTPKRFVDQAMENGQDVILDIEVQGAIQVTSKRPDTVRIFIAPPSWKELERRLRDRGTDDPDKVQKRLLRAKVEFQTAHTYDYFVINDTVEEAVRELDAIITAEHCKPKERMSILGE